MAFQITGKLDTVAWRCMFESTLATAENMCNVWLFNTQGKGEIELVHMQLSAHSEQPE